MLEPGIPAPIQPIGYLLHRLRIYELPMLKTGSSQPGKMLLEGRLLERLAEQPIIPAMQRHRMVPDVRGNVDSPVQMLHSTRPHQLEFECLPHEPILRYAVSVSQEYRRTHTTVSLINYHFVWRPRRRRKVLTGPVENDLRGLLAADAESLDCIVIALEIMPDHVHLFLNCPPSIAPNEIMHQLKGSTSRTLRLKYPHLERMDSLWTRSYFCSTAGNVSSDTIRKYIANQKTR